MRAVPRHSRRPPAATAVQPLAGMLRLLVVQALLTNTAPSHLRYMSFFDPPPLSSLAGGWVNLLHSESVTEAAATFDAAGVPFLVTLTIDGGTGADPAVAAGQGASLLCGTQPVRLCPAWRQRIGTLGQRLRPHMTSGAVAGVFIGDELLSGHQELGYANLVNLSSALRAELGPKALLYANMEASWTCNPCPGRGCFPRVPASWDLVSGDDYWNAAHTNTYTAGFEASKRVYLQCLLPKLAPHQRALLVSSQAMPYTAIIQRLICPFLRDCL